jgi:peptidoglycan/LPS O-acetylase OafA/YrhL
VGSVLGYHWTSISERVTAVSRRPLAKVGWPVVVVVALLLVVSGWLLPGPLSTLSRTVTIPLALVGVTVLVLAAAFWAPLARLLSTRLFRWLGLISFSLYLVHEPIVVAVAQLSHGAVWAVLVAPPVAIAIAVAFYWLVERPTLRLARRVRSGRSPVTPPDAPRTPAGTPGETSGEPSRSGGA